MRVAIVHDYIKEYGGAERVLETLLEIYPDATVYTSLYAPEFLGPHRDRFRKYNIKTTFLNYIPFRHKLISPLRLLSPLAFSSLDLSSYDVVIISQTGAYFPNLVKTKASTSSANNNSSLSERSESKGSGAVHICYTHTPPRYLYGYATARDWKKNKLFAFFAEIANHFLRGTDFNSSKNVDFFIANSEEVAGRIKKFYRRDSTVIYPPATLSLARRAGPPVEVSFPRKQESRKEWIPDQVQDHKTRDYYLTGGRLARAKGIDVIVKAFNKNGMRLKIFGKGFAGYEEELKRISNFKYQISNDNQRDSGQARMTNSNIEFLGEVTDSEKLELMRDAKAFVFASLDEDFGITPVEAMSVGTPVIAYQSGGVKETVLDPSAGSGQVTGLFFDENTPDALNAAIEKFEILRQAQGDKLRENCIKQAEKFSKEKFKKEIANFIEAKLKANI